MGAYASLLTSAYHPETVRGLVLVNGAGKFQEVKAALEAEAEAGLESQAAKEAVREVWRLSLPVCRSKMRSKGEAGFWQIAFSVDCLLPRSSDSEFVCGWSLINQCKTGIQAVGVSSEMPDRNASSAPQSAPKVWGEAPAREAPREKKGFLKGVVGPVQTVAARVAIYVAFIAAKQPARIRKVLRQVTFCTTPTACLLKA